MLILSLLFLLLGLSLLFLVNRRQKTSGLPAGRIIYTDTGAWSPVEKSLFDSDLGLVGRPDYLIQQGDRLIPVEVKTSRVREGPYDSHIFQLAAYCRLAQSAFGKRPPYGILHYPDRDFAIDYTQQLEDALLEIVDGIRSQERKADVDRSHDTASHCRACGYRTACDQKLV
jgi:CRISPR-associated exonuclease Cas4